MGQAIAVRTDFTAVEVRRFAKRAKDAAQARRLLAIAAVLDGASREDAATIGGMDRQTLRDWVIRFNEQGPDSLINIPSPGVPPKLGKKHRAFLLRLVEEGPIPAVHGVVRWRACDLIMIPRNLSLLPLPPRAPELNPQENIWQFMRQNWLSNRIFKSFDDIVDHCCFAWNTLIDQPWKIMSIARRDWAIVGQS